MYPLTSCEVKKPKKALRAIYAIPFIDDVEDFIWEAIFCFVKDIPLTDPLTNIKKKRLFDIVDSSASIGWSAKALQREIRPQCEFELVIQRADIFTKSQELGFHSLSVMSSTEDLGLALLRHWYGKVDGDAKEQGVTDKRICILIKSKDRKTYAFLEEDLSDYKPDELEWRWTTKTKTGLQGIQKRMDFVFSDGIPIKNNFLKDLFSRKMRTFFQLNPSDCQ